MKEFSSYCFSILEYFFSQFQPSLQDKQGQCSAVHASISGHLEALAFLLQLEWRPHQGEPTRSEATLHCIASAAATGNRHVVEYLHHATRGQALDTVDTLLGETGKGSF